MAVKKFVFGSYIYEYTLIKQERKTLSLVVTPNLGIFLKCPLQADHKRIEKFLQRKWLWLEKQLSFFKKYQRKRYIREYMSGEAFLYLGRQYMLMVKNNQEDRVSLTRGKLMVYTTRETSNGNRNKKLIEHWLSERMPLVFQDCFNDALSRFDYDQIPVLLIRDMKRRWGSFLKNNRIVLNPKLMHAPKACILYVITHELCHMKYKNHDNRFWKHLNDKYPRWEKVKDRLEALGSSMDM